VEVRAMLFKCAKCGREFDEPVSVCPDCKTDQYFVGPNCTITDLNAIASIRGLLKETMTAWRIMSDAWSEAGKLADKFPNEPNFEEARKHAWTCFQQEINGYRDHLKLTIDLI
jgi:hypothetical protein